tara:strand:- start:2566 stop:2838 length:273 start_codon:yes stop_codon:yes gene_type:complete
MGLKTLPFRDIENQADNLYEAVAVMSGQARNELQEQILNRTISSHSDEELDVFDEVKEPSPDDYVEKEKMTSVAIDKFFKGKVLWRKIKH